MFFVVVCCMLLVCWGCVRVICVICVWLCDMYVFMYLCVM